MFLYGIHVDPRVPLRQKTEMGPLCNSRPSQFSIELNGLEKGFQWSKLDDKIFSSSLFRLFLLRGIISIEEDLSKVLVRGKTADQSDLLLIQQ